MSKSHSTYVYLGPTLSVEEARKILPNAHYLPPIRCGDILHLMRLHPSRIAIIDGYFEHTPAVWHKEILYAMSKGVSVFGAASMGALRAAELARYGMVGIGKIYQAYCDDPMFGDDEVAVSHFNASYDYQSASQSLVDIRMLLNDLIRDEICSQDLAEKIINQVKSMHYTKRSLISACELVEE